MDNAAIDRQAPELPTSGSSRRARVWGRGRVAGEGFRNARVMGWIALSTLGAAILLSIIIAIASGETFPLYITWISALVMAALSGLIAAIIVVSDRFRSSPAVVETPYVEDIEA
jgi:hypothetical protein